MSETRLLTICPSRRRPEILRRMLDSFYATRTDGRTKIVVYVSEDDPDFEENLRVLRGTERIIGPHRYLAPAVNMVSAKIFPDIPYYQEVNDDHIYRTRGWDETLIGAIESRGRGVGLACGNDGVRPDWYSAELPSACVISGNIVRAIGYFIYPEFRHIANDDMLRDLTKPLGLLFYVPEVIIEHMHRVAGKAVTDENYEWIYGEEEWNHGMTILKKYRENHLESDKNKIIEVSGGGNR